MLWADLFPSSMLASTSAASDIPTAPPPRLGIDFVKASAPEASIPIFLSASTSDAKDGLHHASPAATMVIQQNLSQHGIAGVVWNCARALIFFLQRQPQLLARKRVLELGAGTGAVGLALALALAGNLEALILTDLESVVALTTQNAHFAAREHAQIRSMLERNALSTQTYCWGGALSEALSERVDVVLCSDCLYEPSQYSSLLESLLALTDRQGEKEAGRRCSPMVLIAYKQRIPAREQAFFESASALFSITIDAVDGSACSALGSDTIYICTLERKGTTEASRDNQRS